MYLLLTKAFKSIAVAAACSFLLQGTLPDTWQILGSAREDYEVGVDPAASYKGAPSTRLRSKTGASPDGYAKLEPCAPVDIAPYRGKRIRFSANVKTRDVEGWAGMWMRVNGAWDKKNRHSSTLAYDNMQDRPITGSCEWRRYSVVLDVPSRVREIDFGITLTGTGSVWLNGVQVEVVGKDIPTTGVR